jgi:hypothetical protein
MKKYLVLGLTMSFILRGSFLNAQIITAKNIKKHIEYLASDKLEGRGTGTVGEQKAAQYIAKQFKKVGLQPKGNDGYFYKYTFKKSANPHLNEDPNAAPINTQNVVGYLDNAAEYTIVVGAHYDHLGLGHDANSLDANPEGKIHNGADDNASGTAGVIELARYFKNNGKKEPYNLLFMCFSGEELGLIGSKKLASDSTFFDPSKVNYMVNMDMIGRYRIEKGLMIQGIGTSPLWGKMIDYIPTEMKIIRDSSGVGPSDYTSFYLQKLPVLGFFTGQHTEYHKPTDDIETINFDGEKMVLEYIARVIDATCTFPKMAYQETRQPQSQARSFKVTMGVMPDYAFDKKGMRIDGVTDGKPAFKAGMKTGDVILKIGDMDIENVYGYMDALGKFKKGETAKVVVKRGTEEVVLDVTF